MNLSDALNSPLATGQSTTKGASNGPSSSSLDAALARILKPTRSHRVTHVPEMVQAVVFHPEALTLRETEIDIANPEQAGKWFATTQGTLVCHRFVAAPDVRPELEECIRAIEVLRAFAAKRESYLIGKMFALAEASRPGLVNPHTAPVAVTRSLELANIGMELSHEDPTLVPVELAEAVAAAREAREEME